MFEEVYGMFQHGFQNSTTTAVINIIDKIISTFDCNQKYLGSLKGSNCTICYRLEYNKLKSPSDNHLLFVM